MVPPRFVAVFLIVLSSTKLKRIVGIASPCFTPCCRGNSCDVGLCTWNNNLVRFVSPYNIIWCYIVEHSSPNSLYCENLKNFNVVQWFVCTELIAIKV